MKPRPELPAQEEKAKFDPDEFINRAKATTAERPVRARRTSRVTTGRGKMAAKGFRRVTIDLPEPLYEKLKVTSVKRRRTMRDCVEEAVTAWLDASI